MTTSSVDADTTTTTVTVIDLAVMNRFTSLWTNFEGTRTISTALNHFRSVSSSVTLSDRNDINNMFGHKYEAEAVLIL